MFLLTRYECDTESKMIVRAKHVERVLDGSMVSNAYVIKIQTFVNLSLVCFHFVKIECSD